MKNQTKIIVAVLITISVFIIAGGSFAAYYFLIKNNDSKSESISDKLGITESNNVKEPETVTAEQKPEGEVKDDDDANSDNNTSETDNLDTDNDGLMDTEEKAYGTDPKKADTDGDGYSDYDEINNGFDPLKVPENKSDANNEDYNNEDTGTTQAYPDPQNKMYVFFMHHSTGEIYWNGGLKEVLTDHNYVGYAPWWEGDTDPGDFYGEFSNKDNWDIIASENMPDDKTRDIVLFKSCFPSSNIESDAMLEEYKTNYKKLFEIYAAHPDTLFVPMSTPPLLQVNTTAEAAKRAQDFENWLIDDYVADYAKYAQNNLTFNTQDYNIGGFRIPSKLFSIPKNKQMSEAIAQAATANTNLAPFQLHSLLANSSGYLDSAYQSDPSDDHPNDKSGEIVGEAMWKHLNKAIVEAGMVE